MKIADIILESNNENSLDDFPYLGKDEDEDDDDEDEESEEGR